jgi:hypothetical protein
VKEKVEKDPTLRRQQNESFQEWVKRLGIFSLLDDVHESRRYQLRLLYTANTLDDVKRRHPLTEHRQPSEDAADSAPQRVSRKAMGLEP